MVAKGILEYQPEEHFSRAVRSPDRRKHSRGTDEEPERYRLVAMILGTYREMPGLCLRLNQAARLFGMRSPTCHIVLEDLVRTGRLRRTLDGQYTTS